MKILFIAVLMMFSLGCRADIDGCKEMMRKDSDALLPKIRTAFINGKLFPIDRVSISSGRDCGDNIYYFLEAKPPYQNPGHHWIIEFNKKTAKIRIMPGL